jgi:putative aldouronate transport system permease protein
MILKKLFRVGLDQWFDRFNITFMIVMSMMFCFPLIYVLSSSVSDPARVMNGEVLLWPLGFNLEAYTKVFINERIITGYSNTIQYTLVGTLVNVILTIMVAYPLARKDLYGRKFWTILFTMTMFFSAGLIPNYLVIQQLGLINNFWVMILPGAISMFNVLIMRTFFSELPEEIHDAASIDGCNKTNTLLRVILPVSGPVIAVMVLFYGVAHWNSYFNALIYLNDSDKHTLQLVLREILVQNDFTEMIGTGDTYLKEITYIVQSMKYAIIVVASLPVLMLYPFLQRYFVKGIMIGSIKG